ncbi:MAG: hypothetical protein DWQ08_05775 [Proteobacteria bacterium]|nr:MAG: hypothetical protein DWQ08_05775 [Pseudomonadota bacterium]
MDFMRQSYAVTSRGMEATLYEFDSTCCFEHRGLTRKQYQTRRRTSSVVGCRSRSATQRRRSWGRITIAN